MLENTVLDNIVHCFSIIATWESLNFDALAIAWNLAQNYFDLDPGFT